MEYKWTAKGYSIDLKRDNSIENKKMAIDD